MALVLGDSFVSHLAQYQARYHHGPLMVNGVQAVLPGFSGGTVDRLVHRVSQMAWQVAQYRVVVVVSAAMTCVTAGRQQNLLQVLFGILHSFC